jgi:hypothetical protein
VSNAFALLQLSGRGASETSVDRVVNGYGNTRSVTTADVNLEADLDNYDTVVYALVLYAPLNMPMILRETTSSPSFPHEASYATLIRMLEVLRSVT